MPQININITREFEMNLARFVRLRGFRNKSEAIRAAVQEGLEQALKGQGPAEFNDWIGVAKGDGENPRPRFTTDDDLWER